MLSLTIIFYIEKLGLHDMQTIYYDMQQGWYLSMEYYKLIFHTDYIQKWY